MSHFRTLTEIAFELSRRLPPLLVQGPVFFLAQTEKEAHQLQLLCQYFNATFPVDCVVSPLFLEEHTIAPDQFKRRTLYLKPGQILPISELTHQLNVMGFERFPRAVSPRSFAVRGNVVDIIDRQAVRLEYDGNSIERLQRYDISTQAALAPLPAVTIFPKAYSQHLPLWTASNLQYECVTPKV